MMRTQTKYKISFCTVCMNRLHHLKQTLPKNIEDNISYGNVEFVVLDYNSQDDLDTWIKTEMAAYLKVDVLKYYRTVEPNNFHMSHSKNVVAKVSTGDIVCNVDADNFIGMDFAKYINREFKKDKNIYMAVDRNTVQRDCYGRICLLKEDFMSLKGYDESMKGYGFEDYDFWYRLEALGRKAIRIDNKDFLQAISHGDEERLKDEANTRGIEKIYVRYINHATSELLYLFNNKSFFKGEIIDCKLLNSESIDNLFIENRTFEYAYKLNNNGWELGKWSVANNGINLKSNNDTLVRLLKKNKKKLEVKNTIKQETFHEISKKSHIEEMIMFFSQINNRIKMNTNKKQQILAPNNSNFGEVVFIETPCNYKYV